MNKRNGFGFRLYKNGKVYIGNFKKGQKHGHGQLLSREGLILFEGEYHNDFMHGRGKIYLPGLFCYEGEFHNNKMSGEGPPRNRRLRANGPGNNSKGMER